MNKILLAATVAVIVTIIISVVGEIVTKYKHRYHCSICCYGSICRPNDSVEDVLIRGFEDYVIMCYDCSWDRVRMIIDRKKITKESKKWK